MKRTVSLAFVSVAVLALVGCGNAGEDYDQNKIIKKQEGSGPPPLARPGDSKPTPPTNP